MTKLQLLTVCILLATGYLMSDDNAESISSGI
jgi:hypothetical protein